VSAAWRAFALSLLPLLALAVGPEPLGDGLSVGNRPDALPPGLSDAPVLELMETPGSVPTGTGEVDGVGVGGVVGVVVPLIATVSAAFGSLIRLAALPMTTSRTDFTVEAVAGTGVSASSCRWADFASIAPRLHDADPSLLPQPKLNRGVTLAGVACRRTVASGRFPPLVQALITHCAAAPCLLLVRTLVIWTQRLTLAVWWDDCPPLPAVLVSVLEGEAVGDEAFGDEAVGGAVADCEAVADGDGVADAAGEEAGRDTVCDAAG
jgi:hypothetical protein